MQVASGGMAAGASGMPAAGASGTAAGDAGAPPAEGGAAGVSLGGAGGNAGSLTSAPWAPAWLPTGAFGEAAQHVVDATTEYVFWLCVANRLPIDECARAELHNFAPSLEWLACASRGPDADVGLEKLATQFFACAAEQRQCECDIVLCDVTIPDLPGCPDYQSHLCPSGETFAYRCAGDGSLQCTDGYDERNCDRSAPRYDCGDGEFIAWTAVCDGLGDCANDVDEFRCGSTNDGGMGGAGPEI